MMVSVETCLLRGKRQLEKWWPHPGVRRTGQALALAGGGLVLSAAGIWGQMMPVAAGAVLLKPGWISFASVLGSMVGYRLFWGSQGLQGVLWSIGALVLGFTIRARDRLNSARVAGLFACIVSALGLGFQIFMGDDTLPQTYLLRIAIGALSAAVAVRLTTARDPLTRYVACFFGVLALAGLHRVPWLSPGILAAGVMAAAGPSPGCLLAGAALDIADVTAVPMTAVMCVNIFFRMLPVRNVWWQRLCPGAAAGCVMVLLYRLDPAVAVGITAGGIVGSLIPWHAAFLAQPGNTGAAQVHLEQMSRLMTRLQRLLLESPAAQVDEAAIALRLRQNACGSCSFRDSCREKEGLDAAVLHDPLSFQCRKTGRVLSELRHGQAQLRLIRAGHRRQGEYRGALSQQYAFLAAYLGHMADCLPHRDAERSAAFRLQVSARARGKERADGDRCMAFPGVGCRYYILLCDGMGTGLGAAEEGRKAAALLRQMLCAGLPARYALGSINSHLVLRGQAGAVTVDLAEIRLDSGRAYIYKWGAAPSWFVRRRKIQKIGTAAPPPGISLEEIPETAAQLSLSRGEVLVLVSDGVQIGEAEGLADRAAETAPGELAEWILQQWGGSGEDDATAAVIRLRPTSLAT